MARISQASSPTLSGHLHCLASLSHDFTPPLLHSRLPQTPRQSPESPVLPSPGPSSPAVSAQPLHCSLCLSPTAGRFNSANFQLCCFL